MNLLEEIRAFRELVLRKQDRLTPGDYITIENDVISADLSRVDDVEHDIRDLKTEYAAIIAKNLQQDNTLADHETRLIDAEGDIDDLESGLSDLEEKVDNIHGFDIVPLGEGDYDSETGIPTIENPKTNTLYLVPNLAEEDQKNLWIEWLWIQSKWEQFGAASIDMNNYVKKTDYATTSKTGVVKIKQLGGLTVASNGDLSVSPATVGDISTYTSNPLPITPSTVPDAVYYGLGRISRSGYTYSEQEKINIRQMLGATGVVADVRLDGASTLDSYGVARIPLATAGQKGVIRARSAESSPYNYGVDIPATGTPEIVPAIHSQIKGAPPDYVIKSPIVPGMQHESVFYGLAKAAGDTTQQSAPDSEFPVGTYTPPAITAIQRMIGIGPATDETAGLVKASNIGGIDVDSSGSLGLYPATQANITGRTFGQRPITPENFDFAVKVALTDGLGAEWTDAEKAAARERIGAGQGGGGVTDVTVDDVSVVTDTGVVVFHPSSFTKNASKTLYINDPSANQIRSGTVSFVPLTVASAYQAAFYGLAKAAGDTTMASSSNPVGTYTDEAKTAIKNMLGITPGEEGGVSVTLDDDGDIKIHGLGGQGGGGSVNDVTVNGTSIVDSETGVAEIPSNTSGTPSLWSIDTNTNAGGLAFHPVRRKLEVLSADRTDLLNRYSMKFLESSMVDFATKTAMSAPIGTAGMKDGEYHYPAWTEQEQVRARERLGIGDWELLYDKTLDEDITGLVIDKDMDGNSFVIRDYAAHYDFTKITGGGYDLSNYVFTVSYVLSGAYRYTGYLFAHSNINRVTEKVDILAQKQGGPYLMYYASAGSNAWNMKNGLLTKVGTEYRQDDISLLNFRWDEKSIPAGTRITVYARKASQPSGFKYTDAYINSLIDTKLGVIENGTY